MTRNRSDSLSTSRHRKNSVVKSIALNEIPLIEDHLTNKSLNIKGSATNLKRIRSIDDLSLRGNGSNVGGDDNSSNGTKGDDGTKGGPLMTYPFNDKEKNDLWNQYLDSFEFDNLISFDDEQELVDNLENEKIYQFKDYVDLTLLENGKYEVQCEHLINNLDHLLLSNQEISLETLEFQKKSDDLINKINFLENISNELNKNLNYFNSLDDIIKILNKTNLNIGNNSLNTNILIKLDECLKFVNDPNNAKFKEIELYKMKFRQCMVRALTLIRNYVVEGFKKISNELNSKLKVGMISNVTIEALIYNRFQEDCSKFKPLINELYIRTIIIEEDDESNYDSEYLGLLTDCYNNYFKIRKHFLSSYIHNHLSNYNSTNKVLIHYIQDNISFFSNICNKELKIFKSIFYSSPNLNKYNNKVINNEFQDILNPLYQLARTKILRETSIDRLCDVITLLQKYYEFEYDEGNSEIESVGIGNNENSLDLKFASDDSALNKTIRFDKLFEPILKEVQTKLILRIQVYIDKNILNYKPSGEELTIANRRIKQKQKSENSNADDASFNDTASSIVTTTSMIDENINKTLKEFNIDQDETSSSLYYPPILKSIKLLNKIYQLVDPKIFSDLANSIVHLLILSIRETFEKNYVINNKNKTDLKLYLIKNYIFLKKVLDTNFDIEYVGNESILDFSGLQGLIYGVINKTETTLNDKYRRKSSIGSENGFFNKVLKSVPKYVNNIIDGKQELTVELRNLIHSYIDDCSDIILLPLKSITKDNIQNANEILGDFKKNLNIEIERRKTQILNYIDDDETVVSSLIDGIKESIVNKYENVYQYINELFTKNGVKDTELMEADTLLYFLNN